MKTVEEFAATLSDEVKAVPKLIEEEFKTYCLTANSKQQRLVNRRFSEIFYLQFTNEAAFIYPPTVLLSGRTGNIGYRYIE